MKLKCTLSVTSVFFCLLMIQSYPSIAGEKDPAKKSRSSVSSRNNNAVKIYPDAVRRIMHVIAKENSSKKIDFFVFGLEGTLIRHFKMENGDKQKITGLERGKYVYNVFSGDEETATGEFEIR